MVKKTQPKRAFHHMHSPMMIARAFGRLYLPANGSANLSFNFDTDTVAVQTNAGSAETQTVLLFLFGYNSDMQTHQQFIEKIQEIKFQSVDIYQLKHFGTVARIMRISLEKCQPASHQHELVPEVYRNMQISHFYFRCKKCFFYDLPRMQNGLVLFHS